MASSSEYNKVNEEGAKKSKANAGNDVQVISRKLEWKKEFFFEF